MNIAARRVLLQKALRGAAALMVGVELKAPSNPQTMSEPHWGEPAGLVAAPGQVSQHEQQERKIKRRVDRLLRKQIDALYKRQNTMMHAANNMDLDLQVLRSTAPQWRMLVMYDRIKAKESVAEKLSARIREIWEQPFDLLRDKVEGWVAGIVDDHPEP